MALSSFVRRASSIRSRRCYQNQISLLNIENSFSVGGQFLPFETSGNSPVHGFVRRAYSSIAPLSIRSLGSRRLYQTQISPLGGQFLPCVRFSTVTDDNISSLIRLSAGYIEPMPVGFPFILDPQPSGLFLLGKYQDDRIRVHVGLDTIKTNDPYLPMDVHIDRGSRHMKFSLVAHPNHIDIVRFTTSNEDGGHMKEFEECLEKRGIDSGFISFLFDCFGIKQKNDPTS